MFIPKLSTAAAAALCLCAFTAARADTNLLINGDAEAGVGSVSFDVVPVPGWTVVEGTFTAITYNPYSTGLDVDSPGPVDRGLNYFGGGAGVSFSSATQTVDLRAYQAYFSSHPFTFTLSGWLGGYESQGDYATLSVSFRDANNNEIEFADLQGSGAVARNDTTSLLFASTGFTAQQNVNINPASAVITLSMTRLDGYDNDGYADNLSFTVGPPVAAVPEPAPLALMLAGLGGIGVLLRRRLGAASSA